MNKYLVLLVLCCLACAQKQTETIVSLQQTRLPNDISIDSLPCYFALTEQVREFTQFDTALGFPQNFFIQEVAREYMIKVIMSSIVEEAFYQQDSVRLFTQQALEIIRFSELEMSGFGSSFRLEKHPDSSTVSIYRSGEYLKRVKGQEEWEQIQEKLDEICFWRVRPYCSYGGLSVNDGAQLILEAKKGKQYNISYSMLMHQSRYTPKALFEIHDLLQELIDK